MQNTAAPTESLADHLHEQLEEIEVAPAVRAAAEAIIYNLTEGGLLSSPLEPTSSPRWTSPSRSRSRRRRSRSCSRSSRRASGARDLKECLVLQVTDDEPDAELKRRLLRDHLDDLKRNKIPRIARALGVSRRAALRAEGGAQAPVTRIRARSTRSARTAYIRPDVVVEWDDGEYVVRLENDQVPRLGISPRYRQLIQEAKADPKLREYVKRKVDAAKWLIEAIAQRENTLERVAKEIVARQRDYLDFGVSHLRPLKMQEVADALGIHVSTVSRAISDKHVQTHRGIVPLKFFFTGGTENDDGGVESRVSIKERGATDHRERGHGESALRRRGRGATLERSPDS